MSFVCLLPGEFIGRHRGIVKYVLRTYFKTRRLNVSAVPVYTAPVFEQVS